MACPVEPVVPKVDADGGEYPRCQRVGTQVQHPPIVVDHLVGEPAKHMAVQALTRVGKHPTTHCAGIVHTQVVSAPALPTSFGSCQQQCLK